MKKDLIRVLQVLSSLNTGGTELYVVNNYRIINKQEVQFDFLIFTDGTNYYENEVTSYGGRVYHLGDSKNIIKNMLQIYSFFKKQKYSIVHINSCSLKDILITSIPAKLAGISHIIAHAHSPGTPKNTKIDKYLRILLRELISFTCTDYFACSKNVARAKYPKRLLKNNVKIINNAINLTRFKFEICKREKIRKEYNILDNDKLIGIVGRLEPEKNHIFILQVLKLLNNNYKLFIIGNGALINSLKKEVEQNELNDRVYFTGKVDNVYDYYSAIDLLVIPSLYEGFPFVAVEAQATGCPIFISENVTIDCLLLRQSKQIPIDNGIEKWKHSILNFKKNDCRDKATEIVTKAGYDIYEEVQKLTSMYQLMEKNQ